MRVEIQGPQGIGVKCDNRIGMVRACRRHKSDADHMSAALTLTLWRTFSRGRRTQYTWRDFIDTFVAQPEVVRDKRKVAGFSLGAFEGNRRALPRVEHVHALTLDFDEGDTTIRQAEQLFPKTKSVIYTTFSHKPRHPKLRIILPFERPVDADEYARIWDWAASKITKAGHALDVSTRDASRFWYLPSHRPGAPYEWRELEGDAFDVTRALKSKGIHIRPFPAPVRPLARVSRETPVAGKGRMRTPLDASGADQTFFGRAFAFADMAFGELDNGALSVVCPWASAHTSGTDGDSSSVVFPATTNAGWGLFYCSHAHCAERTTLDLLDVLPPKALDEARREHGSGIVRAKVRAGWMQHLEAQPEFEPLDRFVLRCYPNGGGPPLIWTVKIGSRAHVEGLDAQPLRSLRGRMVDLAVREREITWGRFAG
jgi:hypothetical protein